MSLSGAPPLHYSRLAKFLHWLIAGLVVSQFVLAKLAEQVGARDPLVQQMVLLASHKSLGMTVLMLTIVRLVWRLLNPPPKLPAGLPKWQVKVSAISHTLLYALILLIPISGWLMSSASAYSVSWFSLLVFPDLIDANELLVDRFHTLHIVLTKLLFGLVMVHIAAVAKHHLIDKNQVLERIGSRIGYLTFVISVSACVLVLGSPFALSPMETTLKYTELASKQLAATTDKSQALIQSEQNASVKDSGEDVYLPSWQIDYSKSYIRFSGLQAEVPYSGEWQRWYAEIRFDSKNLDSSHFDFEIDVGSVSTNDKDRDATILGENFLDFENHSTVSFIASNFTPFAENEFSTMGLLTIKGVGRRVVFMFEVEDLEGELILTGKADLDRFDWNIGMGDWADTNWLGRGVKVEVIVVASQ
jgi:cytochrome b561/polyisoprenoid-binding protein YceI